MTKALTPYERFAGDILQNYGLKPTAIHAAPRGFAAETYYVDTDGQSFFLKIMNYPRRQKIFLNGLKVVDALAEQGIDYITKVIKLTSGELYFRKDNSVAALYHIIHGKQSYDFNREEVFKKLAQIYRASEKIPNKDDFMKESFKDWFIEVYEKELHSFMNSEIEGQEALELKELIKPHMDFLESCVEAAKGIVEESRKQDEPFYITHSDFLGNVMINEKGEHFLIDFDEAIFGPLERDGFLCIASQNEESELWLSIMEDTFPDYKVNKTFIKYYLYERFMIDLVSFIRDVLQRPDEDHRRKVINSTRDYLMGWLYPLIIKNS
jgi:Ser/Thr protein kinase RdoA (MazF antagonist)